MSRIFMSHSSLDNREAIALRQWLIEQNPPLANEIFLDLHRDTGIRVGTRWKDALRQASARCEAIICLLSPHWESSAECKTEYRFAEYLNKRIFSVRIAELTGADPTDEWQHIDLFGDGPTTAVDINDGGAPVKFSSEGLHRLRQGIVGAGIGAESFVWPPTGDLGRSPYRGWEPLEEVDAAVFFGRDAQILRGLDSIRGMRRSGVETLFVVLGPSGTGKSSFLRAGLLPRLRRADREFALLDVVRPQRNALSGDTGFAHTIHAARTRMGLTAPNLGAIKKACTAGDVDSIRELLLEVQRVASARLLTEAGEAPLPTLVLPVDQGEELFAGDAGDEAAQFLKLLADLASGDRADAIGLIVAMTIRTDRFVSLQMAPDLADVQSVVFDELKPMPRTLFKEVIVGPAGRATHEGVPIAFEPELVNRLLDDCTEGADTLPLLALTLSRLCADYTNGMQTSGVDSTLTLADYESMGGIRTVVRTEINDLLSTDPAQRSSELQSLRAAFIPWLATFNPDDDQPTRRFARWSDLPEQSRQLIDRFVGKRLLVKDDRDGETIVEVALESLLRQWDDLAGWLAEERDDLKAADALESAAVAWRNNRGDDAWLLQGTRLTEAEVLAGNPAFRDRIAPSRDFLNASRQHENDRLRAETQQREAELRTAQSHAAVLRKRSHVLYAVLAITALVAVVAVILGIVSVGQRQTAVRERNGAIATRLNAEVQGILAGDRPGGDIVAFQKLLAARTLAPPDDGALLHAIAQRTNTLKVFDTGASVRQMALSPDGHVLATAGDDNIVRQWNADTGQPVGPPLTGHTDHVFDVAFSPDGHRLASASVDDTVRLWNADTGQPVGPPLTGHTDDVETVAFSPDGHYLASAGNDATVRLWDAHTGQPIGAPLTGHTHWVMELAFSPDGHTLASASYDDTARLWNVDTAQPIGHPFIGHSQGVFSVAFSPDGRRLATGGEVAARLWDLDTGQPIGDPLTANVFMSFAFSPDGHRLATASFDSTVRLWNADTGQPIGAPLTGHTQPVATVIYLPGGQRLASASFDGTIRIWDTGVTLIGHTDSVQSVTFSPDGHRLATASADGTVRLWNADTGQPVGPPLTGHTDSVQSVTFNPDGHRLATASADKAVRLWDADTGQPVGPPLTGHTDSVQSVAFSPDGHRLATASGDKTVRLWDADSGKPLLNTLGHDYAVNAVAFSPDGRLLATGSTDNTARLWDAHTGQSVGAPVSHTDTVYDVAFSPDGHRLATADKDDTVQLWDVDTGQPVGPPLTGHTGAVNSVVFSPDGHRLATASLDTNVRLWNADTGQPLADPLVGHTGSVNSVVFSPDGHRLATASLDTTVRLWDVEATPEKLCDKLAANMSHEQWRERISPDIPYVTLCPDLPISPD